MSTGKHLRSLAEMPRRDLARLAGIGVLVIYVILFIALNTTRIAINFVFFNLRVPQLIALLLAVGIGVAAGWLLRGRRGSSHPPR